MSELYGKYRLIERISESRVAEVFRAMMGNGILTIEDTEVVYYRGGITDGPEG